MAIAESIFSANAGSLAVLLAFIGILASAAVYIAAAFKSSRDKETLASLQRSLNARKEEIDVQNDKIKELQDREREKDELIKVLEGKVLTLQDLVTGKEAIQELGAKVESLAAATQSKISEVLALAAETRGAVRAINENMPKKRPVRSPPS